MSILTHMGPRDPDNLAAGRLLAMSIASPNTTVRLYAEALARVVAADGIERGRGWLQGIWYTGGDRPVRGDDATTYHDVIAALQPYLDLVIVVRREPER